MARGASVCVNGGTLGRFRRLALSQDGRLGQAMSLVVVPWVGFGKPLAPREASLTPASASATSR